jgi:hypothetical protein
MAITSVTTPRFKLKPLEDVSAYLIPKHKGEATDDIKEKGERG